MRIEYTPRYLKDYADIKDARAKKETDKVERIIGAANNFMELHKMLDIKKYPDLGGYRIRYSGKPEWRIRFELVDDLQTKEKVVKLQIVLPREKYQKFAHKPVNESIEKNTKIIITEKQLTMLKNAKIIKLTESQLKDIVVQKIMEATTTVTPKPILQKLLSIEKNATPTKSPNQVASRVDGSIWTYYANGRWESRDGKITDKPDDTGIWYFAGDNNYQIKDDYVYPNGKRNVYDKKTNKWHDVEQTKDQGLRNIQNLKYIDDNITITNDRKRAYRKWVDTDYFIFWEDGDFRYRFNDVNNKENQHEGTWKIIYGDADDDYIITLKNGQTFQYSKNLWTDPTKRTTPTYQNVSFKLDDVSSGKAVIKKGMKGPVVGELQKIMLELNMKISKTGKVDNTFGPIMDLSVRQFQGTNMPTGSKDGKVGKDTLKRMIEIRDYDGSEEEPEVDDSGANDTTQMTEV